MKILIATNSLPPSGGAEQVAWNLSKELSKNDEIFFLALGPKRENFVKDNIQVYILPLVEHNLRHYCGKGKEELNSLLKKIKPNIINVHGISVLAHALAPFDFKKILTLHHSQIFYERKKSILTRLKQFKYFKRTLNNFNLITTVSSHMKDYVKKVHNKEVFFIPNGINLSNFKPNPEIKKQPNLITYVGRFNDEKGADIFLELVKALPNFEFYIVGQVNKNIPPLPNLKLEGKKESNELPYFYNRTNFCVFPSVSENFPLVGLEAMACGAIVIAFAKGFQEYIESETNGFLVENRTKESFLKIIKQLEDKNLNSLRQNAIKTTQLFDWKKISKKYLELYNKLG